MGLQEGLDFAGSRGSVGGSRAEGIGVPKARNLWVLTYGYFRDGEIDSHNNLLLCDFAFSWMGGVGAVGHRSLK